MVKMNFIICIMIATCFCFIEMICKSIHVHDDFHSEFEVSEDKTLNHRHDSKSKVSWIKLKPILRREFQHAKYVNGAESSKLSAETTQQIQTNNEEKTSKNIILVENEETMSATKQFSNNSIIETKMVKSNDTLFPTEDTSRLEETASNDTNAKSTKLDSLLNKNDSSYNITPDIMKQSGDLIVFLALNEKGNTIINSDSNDAALVNEGTTVTLEGISTTGLQIITDFETQQNLINIKFPNIQRTLNNEKNLANLKKDFNVDFLEKNSMEDRAVLEKSEETYISDVSVISTDKSDVVFAEKTPEITFKDEDDNLQANLNRNSFTDFRNEENNSGTNFIPIENEVTEVAENSSDETLNVSEIALISEDINEIEKSDPDVENSFKDHELFEGSSNRQNNSKCPDSGICYFWFLALDTCEEDSHCHGSLICCKWGCSKMCMDADAEVP